MEDKVKETILVCKLLDWRKQYSAKRDRKAQEMMQYLTRPSDRHDPLGENGSEKKVQETLQAVHDLDAQYLKYCSVLAKCNAENALEIEGVTMTVLEWNHYRDKVLRPQIELISSMLMLVAEARHRNFNAARTTATRRGNDVAAPTVELVVNFDEEKLRAKLEQLKTIQEEIHSALNVFNTTTSVTID